MAKFVEEGTDASAKPKRVGPPKYTGRKGAVTKRAIGSESPYKLISRWLRKQIEHQTHRGPTQAEMQEAKACFHLNTELGRQRWAIKRKIMLGEVVSEHELIAAGLATAA